MRISHTDPPTHCELCGALITRDGFVGRSKDDPFLCFECADDDDLSAAVPGEGDG